MKFYKFTAAGNDFILIDSHFNDGTLKKMALRLCQRRLSIGADGLLAVKKIDEDLLAVRYFNSDSSEAFCGNGSRSAAMFAYLTGLIKNRIFYLSTIRGRLKVEIINKERIKIEMPEINKIKKINILKRWRNINGIEEAYFLDSGVPHAVFFVKDLNKIEVNLYGRQLRHDSIWGKDGANIDFIEIKNKIVYVRTYERGVEEETLSCGTGITACAVSVAFSNKIDFSNGYVKIISKTGDLFKVYLKKRENAISDIYMEGPSKLVFRGEIDYKF
jgi:diaminopimelate epimerase